MIILTLPLPPSGVNHMYKRGRNGGLYKDPKLVDWIDECLYKLKGKIVKTDPSELGILCVNIGLYFGDKRRRDVDNILKPILDLLVGCGAIVDDSLITDLIVAKRIDLEKPRLEVQIY